VPGRAPLPRPLGRRRFLLASAGLLAGSLTTKVARARGLGSPAALAVDTGPLAFLSTDAVPQAGSFSVHVNTRYAATATATFDGRPHDLFPDGDYLVAIVGAGQGIPDQIEMDPGDYEVTVDATAANGKAYSVRLPIAVTKTDFPVDAITLAPSTSALLDPTISGNELTRLAAIYRPVSQQLLWRGLFQQPVVGPITTHFGEARSYNSGPVTGHHSGVDIGVDLGTPVGAGATGRVVFAGQMSERGNFVAIDHGWGVYTGYAHLSQILTGAGAMVQPGDIVGLAGATGLATGPHVHWECCIKGIHVDAMRWTYTLFP
jgi:murein DD-endopeptidase MepM/ murein hydrolase activator NlpD